jgi:hypothetical protein
MHRMFYQVGVRVVDCFWLVDSHTTSSCSQPWIRRTESFSSAVKIFSQGIDLHQCILMLPHVDVARAPAGVGGGFRCSCGAGSTRSRSRRGGSDGSEAPQNKQGPGVER